MRRLLLFIILATFIVGGVASAKIPAKQAPRSTSSVDFGRSLTEGFEGDFPPAGWGAGVTNAGYTWFKDGESFYEGAYAAKVAWQDATPQDETLSLDYEVQAGESLSFWTMGSVYWAASAANFTVEIDGLTVYDFGAEGSDNFIWEEVVVDLAPYVGTTVNVTFRYAGVNGADHHLDAVNLGVYTPPPPPPPVDFCSVAAALNDVVGVMAGNTCGSTNQIQALGCETYPEAGLESYYSYELCAGGTFSATVTSNVDGALWIVGECYAEPGELTCLAYADETISGEPETISYVNSGAEAVMLYLVVDSWGADSCGAYVGEYAVEGCDVANENMGFGDLKAQYR
jgi:hypothetical protein